MIEPGAVEPEDDVLRNMQGEQKDREYRGHTQEIVLLHEGAPWQTARRFTWRWLQSRSWGRPSHGRDAGLAAPLEGSTTLQGSSGRVPVGGSFAPGRALPRSVQRRRIRRPRPPVCALAESRSEP